MYGIKQTWNVTVHPYIDTVFTVAVKYFQIYKYFKNIQELTQLIQMKIFRIRTPPVEGTVYKCIEPPPYFSFDMF